MKIRLEGTQKEIDKIIDFLQFARVSDGNGGHEGNLQVKSISKFYINRDNSLNRSVLDYVKTDDLCKTGRVYLDIE